MNKDEYVIINRTALEKRIENLEKQRDEYSFNPNRADDYYRYNSIIKVIKEVSSQSTPLIPEIEKAFDEAFDNGITASFSDEYATMKQILKDDREDYIKQLTLNI